MSAISLGRPSFKDEYKMSLQNCLVMATLPQVRDQVRECVLKSQPHWVVYEASTLDATDLLLGQHDVDKVIMVFGKVNPQEASHIQDHQHHYKNSHWVIFSDINDPHEKLCQSHFNLSLLEPLLFKGLQ